MIFGRSFQEKCAEALRAERWWAWHPVGVVETGQVVWCEWVYRKRGMPGCAFSHYLRCPT